MSADLFADLNQCHQWKAALLG